MQRQLSNSISEGTDVDTNNGNDCLNHAESPVNCLNSYVMTIIGRECGSTLHYRNACIVIGYLQRKHPKKVNSHA